MTDVTENQEWLQKRLGRFTASEIHKLFVSGKKKDELFGQGALTYIRTKAAELLTMEVKEEIDFKQARWGKENEKDAVLSFENKTGKRGNYYGAENPLFFSYGEYAGGSPDWESFDETIGADIKCPYNSAEHLKNLQLTSVEDFKKERWEYYCQGQHNMLIRNWSCFHFVSFDPRVVEYKFRIKIITMYPDSEWIKEYNMRYEAAVLVLNDMLESLDKMPSTPTDVLA